MNVNSLFDLVEPLSDLLAKYNIEYVKFIDKIYNQIPLEEMTKENLIQFSNKVSDRVLKKTQEEHSKTLDIFFTSIPSGTELHVKWLFNIILSIMEYDKDMEQYE